MDIIDVDKELARLDKDRKNAQKDIDFLSKKLSNQGFLAKAPAQLIEAEKGKACKGRGEDVKDNGIYLRSGSKKVI